jgi:hypothetical protein
VPADNSVVVGSQLPSAQLNAMFDSTHFKNAAKIKLTLKVWDSNGGYYEINLSAPAKNRIYALGNHTFSFFPFTDQILETVQQDAQTANYSAVTPQEDRKPSIISTIPAYTVLVTIQVSPRVGKVFL